MLRIILRQIGIDILCFVGFTPRMECSASDQTWETAPAVLPAAACIATATSRLLGVLRKNRLLRSPNVKPLENYDQAIDEAKKLTTGDLPKAFQLSGEPDELRNRYGSEFGQRCLLARRLVETGVRFIEVSYNLNFVNGTGWDTHRHGQKNQHLLIRDLDQALSSLVVDLEQRRRL